MMIIGRRKRRGGEDQKSVCVCLFRVCGAGFLGGE
jgi:hypothetical protein